MKAKNFKPFNMPTHESMREETCSDTTGLVARWQEVAVHGPLGAPAAGLVGEARPDVECDGEGLVHAASAPSSRPKRRTFRSASA